MKNTTIKMTALAAALTVASFSVQADSREQAKRIHERLTGVTPSEETLLIMADLIDDDVGGTGAVDAADEAMNNPAFYNVTLKNWATPWTNRDFDVFQPMNDYTATVIGLVRDEADFREVLYEDVAYRGTAALGITGYSTTNNDHYEELEEGNFDLSDPANFERVSQSLLTEVPTEATAGVMTSRAAAKSFFILGTNRAMFRFTLMNHLCTDLEQLSDVTRAPDRIRQDVSRSPGGDARVFLNNCIGCHAGMDPLAQAFAYYNYEYDSEADPDAESGQITYNSFSDTDPETGTRVVAKYHINGATFPYGYVTPDDHWDNYWREGKNDNETLGWDPSLTGSGDGAKSLGIELANSNAFAYCQVEKVFEEVCLREPGDEDDRNEVDSLVTEFKSGYNLKQVFAGTADYCKGE